MSNRETAQPPADPPRQRLAARALWLVGGGAFVLAIAAAAIANMGGLSAYFLCTAVGSYVVAAAIIPRQIAAFHPHARFGLANTITLVRLLLTCLLAGVAVELWVSGPGMAGSPWSAFALAAVALVLDGLDGMAARKFGVASAFGARFDMEVDAFLILVLSVLALGLGKAGPWVLAIGIMRPAYVALGMIWPVLAGPVPPAWRRKAIAVVQGWTLAALLTPVVQPPMSELVAAAALALLVYSFGIDIVMLVRARRP